MRLSLDYEPNGVTTLPQCLALSLCIFFYLCIFFLCYVPFSAVCVFVVNNTRNKEKMRRNRNKDKEEYEKRN